MLAIIACLVGVFGLLLIPEILHDHKFLKGENRRKFVHITVGVFVTFWPWLISWRAIQVLGLAMLAVVLLNRSRHASFFHFNKNIKRATYGDIFFAIAIIASAVLTHHKIFFTVALLNLALADGLASVIGKYFEQTWHYKVYGHSKTLIGTMVFWLVSTCIFGIGLLFAHNFISYTDYALLVIFLPPALTILENVSIMGLDDLVIPLAVIAVLRLVQVY